MKTIYWNVDTQYNFMRNDKEFRGSLSTPDARSIEGILFKVTNRARWLGIQIVSTADWHSKESKQLSYNPDFKITFPEHCMIDSPGAKFVPATKPANPFIIDWRDKSFDRDKLAQHTGDVLIYKDDIDVFKGNHLTGAVLDVLKPTNICVYGVFTDKCVDAAIVGLVERGYNVSVIKNAIKELPGVNVSDFYNMWMGLGVELVTFYE